MSKNLNNSFWKKVWNYIDPFNRPDPHSTTISTYHRKEEIGKLIDTTPQLDDHQLHNIHFIEMELGLKNLAQDKKKLEQLGDILHMHHDFLKKTLKKYNSKGDRKKIRNANKLLKNFVDFNKNYSSDNFTYGGEWSVTPYKSDNAKYN